MQARGYAIDVSHHQDPRKLPWKKAFEGSVDAVIARAGYGAGLLDRRCGEHIAMARSIGAKVGLYLFFRPTQSARGQFDLLRRVADSVKLGPGDIVPTLDVEHDPFPKPGHNVSPGWLMKVEDTVEMIDNHFGAKCMIYITQREFNMLGAPAWMLEPSRPIWVAHYTTALEPVTPGNRGVVMWQHRVAPFVAYGPGGYDRKRPELDQNRILGDLPLLGEIEEDFDEEDFDDISEERILELTGEELDAIEFGLEPKREP